MEERGRRGDFHLLRSSWLADLPAPVEFLAVFQAGNPNNLTGWEDREYDRLLEQARHVLDPGERNRLLRTAEERLLNDAPIIPILHYATVQLIKPYVEGLTPNPLDVIGWAGLRVNLEWRPPR
jgi:oligopeptide transport system substrate-binding protein